MTLILKLKQDIMKMYHQTKKNVSMSTLLKFVTQTETNTQTDTDTVCKVTNL